MRIRILVWLFAWCGFGFLVDADPDPDFQLMRMRIRIQVNKMMRIRIHNTAVFHSELNTLSINCCQAAPGWPGSAARGVGGEGPHGRQNILHWPQHQVKDRQSLLLQTAALSPSPFPHIREPAISYLTSILTLLESWLFNSQNPISFNLSSG